MSMTVTLWLLAGLTAFGIFSGWRGAQLPNPHRGPRLVPWRFLMVMCAAADFMLLVHALSLLEMPEHWTRI